MKSEKQNVINFLFSFLPTLQKTSIFPFPCVPGVHESDLHPSCDELAGSGSLQTLPVNRVPGETESVQNVTLLDKIVEHIRTQRQPENSDNSEWGDRLGTTLDELFLRDHDHVEN